MSSVAQLIQRASRILNDQEEGYSYTAWTTAELLDYYNEALCAVYNMRPDLFAVCQDITLAPGSKQTLDAGTLISIDSNVDECGNSDPDTPLTMSSTDMVKGLAGKKTCSSSAASPCEPFVITGYRKGATAGIFFVEPPVPTGGDPVVVEATVSAPPVIVCGGDIAGETQIDCGLDSALVDWVLYRALSRDVESQFNFNAARRHQAAFYDAVNASYLADSRLQSGYMLGMEGQGVETTGWRNELRNFGR